MSFCRTSLLAGVAAAALATPVLAVDNATDKQKQQYLYDQTMKQQQGAGAAGSEGPIGATKPNSGPGVQGAPDTRTGPATHAPAGSAESGAASPDASSSSGASSGDTGQSTGPENTTQPSQDSSGVQGFPDTRTGPATKAPSGGAQ
jgi:type II secretory pathway pseudopilin PulG